jgi:Putative cyclase
MTPTQGDNDDVARATPLPRWAELSAAPRRPAHSSWGLFGDDDELGTINLLGPSQVQRGASLVRKGSVFSLNWALEQPDPPLYGRRSIVHGFIDGGHTGTDDFYDSFHPQISSQWDALSHIPHPEHGFYNGRTLDDVRPITGNRNGIHNFANHGIVGRFVLIDVERYFRDLGRDFGPETGVGVGAADLAGAVDHFGIRLEHADVLLLHFGWIEWYERQSASTKLELATSAMPRASGLLQSESTAEWLWDNHFAAVAADNPGLEAAPFEFVVGGFLHYDLIPLLGMAVGELFKLHDLAADCASDGVYDGLFSAAPLNKYGGIGSTANALAIK